MWVHSATDPGHKPPHSRSHRHTQHMHMHTYVQAARRREATLTQQITNEREISQRLQTQLDAEHHMNRANLNSVVEEIKRDLSSERERCLALTKRLQIEGDLVKQLMAE